MELREAIANRIKELCKEKGITIYRLAQLSGVPHTTIMSIFSGATKNPSVTTIDKLCKALDITLAEFFKDSRFI